RRPDAQQLQRSVRLEVLELEDLPKPARADLTATGGGMRLHRLRELDLQPPRQVEIVLRLHDVGDAALTGLGVHPDNRLVRPADVEGIDGQVRSLPGDFPTHTA